MDEDVSGKDLPLNQFIKLCEELGDVLVFCVKQGVSDVLHKASRVYDLVHAHGCGYDCLMI